MTLPLTINIKFLDLPPLLENFGQELIKICHFLTLTEAPETGRNCFTVMVIIDTFRSL